MIYYQFTDQQILVFNGEIQKVIDYLPAVDISIYFAYLLELYEIEDILDQDQNDIISNDIDVNAYNKYKETKDAQSENVSCYVHDFVPIFNRPLKKSNGKIYTQILPAMFAPNQIVRWWASKKLKCGKKSTNKVRAWDKMGFCCSKMIQGAYESHFRVWVKGLYVIYQLYISYIYQLYLYY